MRAAIGDATDLPARPPDRRGRPRAGLAARRRRGRRRRPRAALRERGRGAPPLPQRRRASSPASRAKLRSTDDDGVTIASADGRAPRLPAASPRPSRSACRPGAAAAGRDPGAARPLQRQVRALRRAARPRSLRRPSAPRTYYSGISRGHHRRGGRALAAAAGLGGDHHDFDPAGVGDPGRGAALAVGHEEGRGPVRPCLRAGPRPPSTRSGGMWRTLVSSRVAESPVITIVAPTPEDLPVVATVVVSGPPPRVAVANREADDGRDEQRERWRAPQPGASREAGEERAALALGGGRSTSSRRTSAITFAAGRGRDRPARRRRGAGRPPGAASAARAGSPDTRRGGLPAGLLAGASVPSRWAATSSLHRSCSVPLMPVPPRVRRVSSPNPAAFGP